MHWKAWRVPVSWRPSIQAAYPCFSSPWANRALWINCHPLHETSFKTSCGTWHKCQPLGFLKHIWTNDTQGWGTANVFFSFSSSLLSLSLLVVNPADPTFVRIQMWSFYLGDRTREWVTTMQPEIGLLCWMRLWFFREGRWWLPFSDSGFTWEFGRKVLHSSGLE